MATIKSKQLGRKQLKRTYKIPRSLKKSIKKNLVKIVKRREQEIREEEREKFFVHHEIIMCEIRSHLESLDEHWESHAKCGELSNALDVLINRGLYKVTLEEKIHEGGLEAQKAFARETLANGSETQELQKEIRFWLIEQGENAIEVEKLGKKKEEEVEDEDEDNGLDTTEEYDWTSTSTLD